MADYPDSPEASTCGNLPGHDGENGGILPFLEKSIAMEPTPQAYFNLAELIRASYASRIRFLPGIASSWTGKRVSMVGVPRGIGWFREAHPKNDRPDLREIFPEHGRFERAFEHLTEGRYEEARDGFQEVLALEPTTFNPTATSPSLRGLATGKRPWPTWTGR